MEEYRIVEKVYDNGTKSFHAQYFMGKVTLEFSKQCGYTSDGWINISDEKDTYRKALLRITRRKNSTMKCSVVPIKNIKETIIHNIN